MGEHLLCTQKMEVRFLSLPPSPCSLMVERHPCKMRVAGSIPAKGSMSGYGSVR